MTSLNLPLTTTAGTRGLFARLGAWAGERLAAIGRRRAFEQLAGMDDHMLDDMGVTREEVNWALSLPFSVNAAIELQKIAHQRRRARFGHGPGR